MKQKNKNSKTKARIIELCGLSGCFKLAFIGICAVAGFGIFPGAALMYLWNIILAANTPLPRIELVQGLLLYGIILITYFICRRPKFSISYGSLGELSDEELEQIFSKVEINAEKRVKMTSVDLCQSKLEKLEQPDKDNAEDTNKKEV